MRHDRWSLKLMRSLGERVLIIRRQGGTEAVGKFIFDQARDNIDGTVHADAWGAMGVTSRFCADWAESAFPTVQCSERLGASFMATRVPPDVLPELKSPWPTMVLQLPANSLICHELVAENGFTETEYYHWVLVQNVPSEDPLHLDLGTKVTHANWLIVPVTAAAGMMAPIRVRSMREMSELSETLEAVPGNWLGERRSFETHRDASVQTDAVASTLRMLLRFVLGCLLDLHAERQSVETQKRARSALRRRAGREPTVWAFTLARPVKVDCRKVVREASERGEGYTLKMQSLVRGHWKNQPCGTNGADRKFIHVEPYWRGPEDAPIAVRSHVLGNTAAP